MYLIDSQSIKELMENKEKIMQMNDWLFELYKDAVTETFLNQLIDGSFDKDMIIGVEANGEDAVGYTIQNTVYNQLWRKAAKEKQK